jgi:hypothetical protein
MESNAGGGLGVGQGRLIVQEQGQFGPLPQLVADGAAADENSGLGEELGGEVGAVGGRWSGHGENPVRMIERSIRDPHSLAEGKRVVEPYSYF